MGIQSADTLIRTVQVLEEYIYNVVRPHRISNLHSTRKCWGHFPRALVSYPGRFTPLREVCRSVKTPI
uniref:Uncharacterized protein n=1 Tax=Arion vulgaris TaxID=1028688 RepID=A0A0B7AYW7_9EUPU